MRTLTLSEMNSVNGGFAIEAGAAIGALYGAGVGFSVVVPFAGIGMVFALAANVPGLAAQAGMYCLGALGLGTVAGAAIGGLLGAGVGAAGSYAAEYVDHKMHPASL